MRAPKDLTAAELNGRARSYFQLFSAGANSMLDVLSNRSLYSQWVELRWHLGRALDSGALGDALAEFGITSKGDGSYDVDLKRYPQWLPLQLPLSSFLAPATRDGTLEHLNRRGLSAAETQAIRAYVELNPYPTHPGGVSRSTQDQLSESFAVKLQAKQARGQRLQRSDTLSFVYQRFRMMEEESRAWGLGLFLSVGSDARQVLQTFSLEHQGIMAMAGSDPEAHLAEMEQGFASGEILRRIQADHAKQEETRQ